jgi:hypothetical protein
MEQYAIIVLIVIFWITVLMEFVLIKAIAKTVKIVLHFRVI